MSLKSLNKKYGIGGEVSTSLQKLNSKYGLSKADAEQIYDYQDVSANKPKGTNTPTYNVKALSPYQKVPEVQTPTIPTTPITTSLTQNRYKAQTPINPVKASSVLTNLADLGSVSSDKVKQTRDLMKVNSLNKKYGVETTLTPNESRLAEERTIQAQIKASTPTAESIARTTALRQKQTELMQAIAVLGDRSVDEFGQPTPEYVALKNELDTVNQTLWSDPTYTPEQSTIEKFNEWAMANIPGYQASREEQARKQAITKAIIDKGVRDYYANSGETAADDIYNALGASLYNGFVGIPENLGRMGKEVASLGRGDDPDRVEKKLNATKVMNEAELEKIVSKPENARGTLRGTAVELAESMGQNIPGYVMSLINPVAGAATLAGQMAGQAYSEARDMGKSVGRSLAFATEQGLEEYVTDRILGIAGGAIGGSAIGNTQIAKTIKEAVQSLGKTALGKFVAQTALNLTSEGLSEFAQEFLQYYTENASKEAFLGEKSFKGNVGEDLKEALHAGWLGFLNALIMGGGATAINGVQNYQYMNELGKQSDIRVDSIKAIKEALDTDKSHYGAEEYYKVKNFNDLLDNALKTYESGKELSTYQKGALEASMNEIANIQNYSENGYDANGKAIETPEKETTNEVENKANQEYNVDNTNDLEKVNVNEEQIKSLDDVKFTDVQIPGTDQKYGTLTGKEIRDIAKDFSNFKISDVEFDDYQGTLTYTFADGNEFTIQAKPPVDEASGTYSEVAPSTQIGENNEQINSNNGERTGISTDNTNRPNGEVQESVSVSEGTPEGTNTESNGIIKETQTRVEGTKGARQLFPEAVDGETIVETGKTEKGSNTFSASSDRGVVTKGGYQRAINNNGNVSVMDNHRFWTKEQLEEHELAHPTITEASKHYEVSEEDISNAISTLEKYNISMGAEELNAFVAENKVGEDFLNRFVEKLPEDAKSYAENLRLAYESLGLRELACDLVSGINIFRDFTLLDSVQNEADLLELYTEWADDFDKYIGLAKDIPLVSESKETGSFKLKKANSSEPSIDNFRLKAYNTKYEVQSDEKTEKTLPKKNDISTDGSSIKTIGGKDKEKVVINGVSLPRKISQIEGQLELNFGDEQTSEQRRLAAEAISGVEDIISSNGNVKTVGNSITLLKSLEEKENVSLVGKKVKNALDLATLAQVYRDPRFETSRIFFIDKNNNVVWQTGTSSRCPSRTTTIAESYNIYDFYEKICDLAKSRGAVSAWTTHNHPSGKTTPSGNEGDKGAAKTKNRFFTNNGIKWNGEVIIDHNEYSVLYFSGGSLRSQTKINEFEDTLKGVYTPSIPNDLLGSSIIGADAMAKLAKNLEVDKDISVLVWGNSVCNINCIQEAKNSFVVDQKKMSDHIINASPYFGGAFVAVVTKDESVFNTLKRNYRKRGLIDVVYVDENNNMIDNLWKSGYANDTGSIFKLKGYRVGDNDAVNYLPKVKNDIGKSPGSEHSKETNETIIKSYDNAVASGDEQKAREEMLKYAKRKNYKIVAYHGTGRADRVGNVFREDRATSGPMAFFTDTRKIAEGYAKDKRDTSMDYDEDYSEYSKQFKIKTQYGDKAIGRLWASLSRDQQETIREKAGHVWMDTDQEDSPILYDKGRDYANGAFQDQIKVYRGNVIDALVYQWLDSGTLFNEESKFLEVLDKAGVSDILKEKYGNDIFFKGRNYREEKVYDVLLRIRNPFDTKDVDANFVKDFNDWVSQQDMSKYEKAAGWDFWDKNSVSVKEFTERLEEDIKNSFSAAWTSIPDFVTDYLKSKGYDGIKDMGGKGGGLGHTVWIPFYSSQVKSAETITKDDNGNIIPLNERFDKNEDDIRKSTEPKAPSEKTAREMLRRKSSQYLNRAENNFVNNISSALGASKYADRSFVKKAAQKVSNEYLETGTISEQTRNELFDEAYEQARVKDEYWLSQNKRLSDEMKNTIYAISDSVLDNITDSKDWLKDARKYLRFAPDGESIDSKYKELADNYPDMFPDITNEADQIEQILDVAKNISNSERTLEQYHGDSETFKEWSRRDFDEALNRHIAELNRVKRFNEDTKEKRAYTVDELKDAFKNVHSVKKSAEKAVAKNLLTTDDNIVVGRLLRGEETLEGLDPEKYNVKGIKEVYEAKKAYEDVNKVIKTYNAERKAKLREEASGYLKDSNKWKDKSSGFAYARETMERNFRDIIGSKKEAQEVVDYLITPVHKAEASKVRYKDAIREKVKKLDLSRKVENGNTCSESFAVQFIGEAEDNIKYLEAHPKDKTRAGLTKAEWQEEVKALWANNPNLDKAKISKSIEEFRKIYNKIRDDINNVYLANGYEPVPYRSGYFMHFMQNEPDGVLGKIADSLGIRTDVTNLPTAINGQTGMFRPGRTWFGSGLERKGNETIYDAVLGIDKYLESASDVIFQTENIQRLRQFTQEARYRTSDEGLQKQMDEIRLNNALTEAEKDARIAELYSNGKYALSNLVVELDEYTNLLANKKSKADRVVESYIGRKLYNIAKAFEQNIAGNMVTVNIASQLTNLIPIVQANAVVDSRSMLRGMWDTLRGYSKEDGFVDRSDYLTSRFGSDNLVARWEENLNKKGLGAIRQKWMQGADKLGSGMDIVDNFTSEAIVRARYYQNLKSGMSEANAIKEADAFVAGLQAARTKGAMPTYFGSTNPIRKMFTQFQLEVNNNLSWLFKDVPDEAREKGMGKLFIYLLKYAIGSYLFNELYEFIFGRRPALDPLGMLNDTVGDVTGYKLPNMLDYALGRDSFETDKKSGLETITSAGKNIAEELPFVGRLLGGGRVPISGMLPDVSEIAKAWGDAEASTEYKWSVTGKELGNTALYLALPGGASQVSKTAKGLKAVSEGGSYKLTKDGTKNIQYPVWNETTGDIIENSIKGALFGKSSYKTARDWVEKGFPTLNDKYTSMYDGMVEVGTSQKDAWKFVNDFKSIKKTETETEDALKEKFILESNISDEAKGIAYDSMQSDPSKAYTQWKSMGGDPYDYLKLKNSGFRTDNTDVLDKLQGRGIDANTIVKNYDKKAEITDVKDNGFKSYDELKKAIGGADTNEDWHHIVEQTQKKTLAETKIQNSNNVVSIAGGSQSMHSLLTAYYGSVQDFTNGKTVREWLSTKSFEEQWEFGAEYLEKHGTLIPGEESWTFIPNKTNKEIEAEIDAIKNVKVNEAKTEWSNKGWDESTFDNAMKSFEDNDTQTSVFQFFKDNNVPQNQQKYLYDYFKEQKDWTKTYEEAKKSTSKKVSSTMSLPKAGERIAMLDKPEDMGRYGEGNIDLYNRPQYTQKDGSISTVNTITIEEDGTYIDIPTIVSKNGKATQLTEDEAIDWYHKTGEYLGKFDTLKEATNYAKKLHLNQESFYKKPSKPKYLQMAT